MSDYSMTAPGPFFKMFFFFKNKKHISSGLERIARVLHCNTPLAITIQLLKINEMPYTSLTPGRKARHRGSKQLKGLQGLWRALRLEHVIRSATWWLFHFPRDRTRPTFKMAASRLNTYLAREFIARFPWKGGMIYVTN